MLARLIFLSVLLISGFASAQRADETVHPDDMLRTGPEIVLTPEEKSMLERHELQFGPRLFGGRPVNANELRPSVYIGNCTASIIGVDTIITAGHCRSTGSSAAFTLDQTRYSGTCKQHPDYSDGRWLNNDFALCKFSPKIQMAVYATLQKTSIEKGGAVTMQGYGAGSNGKLNVGQAVVLRGDDMEYVTKGAVYLGGGDSGGGLFAGITDLVNGPFVIVGINSRGGGNTSYFNRTDLDRSQKWFQEYAKSEKVEICGINRECGEGSGICLEEREMVKYLRAQTSLAEKELEMCHARP